MFCCCCCCCCFRYNLLREENEGYAKLLTLLLSGGTLQQEHLPALTREVKGLIGTFKLDPNRVCDLVLDAAERDEAGVGAWLQLLGLFNKQAPMQVGRFQDLPLCLLFLTCLCIIIC